MSQLIDTPDRKTCGQLARNLAASLRSDLGVDLKHAQALDLLAHTLGFRNRHAMEAAQNPSGAKGEAAQPRPLPGALDRDTFDAMQRIVLDAYQDGEFDRLENPREVPQQGDTLLSFLMIECSEPEDCDSHAEAVDRLNRAITDVQEVADAFEARADAGQPDRPARAAADPLDIEHPDLVRVVETAYDLGCRRVTVRLASGDDITPAPYAIAFDGIAAGDPDAPALQEPSRLRFIGIGLATAYRDRTMPLTLRDLDRPVAGLSLRVEFHDGQAMDTAIVIDIDRTAPRD